MTPWRSTRRKPPPKVRLAPAKHALTRSPRYCANNWGVVDGEPFADNAWFRSPYGYTDDIPGAPNISNVPRWLDESTAYVYCAGDRLSPEARDDFCRGSGDQPEGRGTYEGLRLQNRQASAPAHRPGPPRRPIVVVPPPNTKLPLVVVPPGILGTPRLTPAARRRTSTKCATTRGRAATSASSTAPTPARMRPRKSRPSSTPTRRTPSTLASCPSISQW